MKQLVRAFMGTLVVAFMLAGVTANPALAQAKGKAAKSEPTTKTILENDKVKVTETTWKPGAEGASVARPVRVTRAIKGGTLLRTYADGKAEKGTYKTGEVQYFGATPPYAIKNIGKADVVLYTVNVK